MLVFNNEIIVIILSTTCIIITSIILYLNLPELTDLSNNTPKIRTLQFVTIFDLIVLISVIILAFFIKFELIEIIESNEKIFAACIIVLFILISGNIAPILPFNQHTGLRLPWTITDKDTWIIAHKLVSYISIPLVLIYFACLPIISNFKLLTGIIILLWIGIPSSLSFIFYYKKLKEKIRNRIITI